MSTKTGHVLVVGAGITGSATCALLRAAGIAVTVWERSSAVGGRMRTTCASSDPRMHADLGAQYVSVGAGGGNHSAVLSYDKLVQAGVLAAFNDVVVGARENHFETTHFVAPRGLGSVCEHMLSSANSTVLNREAVRIDHDISDKRQWRVMSACGEQESFDAVVVAVPAPAVAAFQGGGAAALTQLPGLAQVSYSRRWAAAIYYPHAAWQALSRLPWAAKYVTKQEDDALVFISFESRKRGFGQGEPGGAGPVLVVHTSVPWGFKHQGDSAESVTAELLSRVNRLVAIEIADVLPEPVEVHSLLWEESQVKPGTELGKNGIAALPIEDSPLLVMAGDAVSGSNFENSLRSAMQATDLVVQAFGREKAAL